ncbi:MAG: carbon-nitrogen hydrolase [Planctomycetota bacterium]|nr:MAG: carbon-nitrogen hydrolase [Planctomycetota bacterium]
MRVCNIQFELNGRSKEDNVSYMMGLVDQVEDADLINLPEIWSTGYFNFDEYKKNAEAIDGDLVTCFKEKAKAKNCYILMGSFVEKLNEEYFNTSVLISHQGEVVGCYRKIHLFGYESKEASILTKGSESTVISTPWGKVGLATCYDLRFPELFRKMSEQGAVIFLVVSAWPLARLEAWRLFCQARAHENLAYLISCNCAGKDQEIELAGHSMVVDPMGEILRESKEIEEVVNINLDINNGLKIRDTFPALNDRQIF